MGELYEPFPKLPKNIRQIGERDQVLKLYLEDYVNTYLKRLHPTGDVYKRQARDGESMSELKRRPLFNPQGDTEVNLRRMIGGNTTNLNDFNNMKYPWVSGWYRQAMNNFWIPEEKMCIRDRCRSRSWCG